MLTCPAARSADLAGRYAGGRRTPTAATAAGAGREGPRRVLERVEGRNSRLPVRRARRRRVCTGTDGRAGQVFHARALPELAKLHLFESAHAERDGVDAAAAQGHARGQQGRAALLLDTATLPG